LYKIYVSPSVQEHNVGLGDYGTEEKRMNEVADWFMYYMAKQPKFICKRNDPSWGMTEIKKDSDAFGAHRHLAMHSNADKTGKATGTRTYYADGYEDSKRYATAVHNAVAAISPGEDKTPQPDTVLYSGGLGELRSVKATAALIELGYHTNLIDAKDIVNRCRLYGKVMAKATVEDFNEVFIDPDAIPEPNLAIKTQGPVKPEDLPDVLMQAIIPEGTRFIKLPVGYLEFIPETGRAIWHRDKHIYISIDGDGVTAYNHGKTGKIV
jgi:N-acetylmuramoyl-L-alanine amidase